MIEGAVFADQHNDVLDGGVRATVFMIVRLERAGERSSQAELNHSYRKQSCSKRMEAFRGRFLQLHAFSSIE
jgi:hypothetical protein